MTLASGCSLGPEDESEGSRTGTASSTSSPTSSEETVTETATDPPSPEDTDTGFETSTSVTSERTSETSDGSGESAPDAEQAVEDFGQAIQDEDFDAMCDAFDPELVEAMEVGDQSCSDLFEENWDEMGGDIPDDAEMDVRRSELSDDGRSATVTVKNDADEEQDIPLKKVSGDWKISVDEM